MVVIRKNGKMVVYFNSTNKTNDNNQVPLPENFDETECDDRKFREWQKHLVEDSQVRVQRNAESNFETKEQKRIRKMMNTHQKNKSTSI